MKMIMKRILPAAMVLVMCVCMATSALATDTVPEEITVSEEISENVVDVNVVAMQSNMSDESNLSWYGHEGIVVDTNELCPSEEQVGVVDDTVREEDGIMPITSGNLSANSGYSFGSVTIGSGGTLTVTVSYTPKEATLRYGYTNSDGKITYVTAKDGYGSHAFSISKADTYRIYIYNPSAYDVSYEIHYITA